MNWYPSWNRQQQFPIRVLRPPYRGQFSPARHPGVGKLFAEFPHRRVD
ncbi:MAG: hypothetical protein H0U76_02590 [Ktedonobacteraceae bacterium]|nr:hypothetical protein [Ktedonobacteraceae bacterium]